jgi:sulfite reductase (NADPH) hemoprotein beta-component
LLVNVKEQDREGITRLLAEHGVAVENQASVLRRNSMACPALPTCGLALAESERMLPGLVDRLETLCTEAGLGGEEIIIRSTGCPNGCARPYAAEIGFVGKAPGRYQIWLGGNASGTRMARIWKDVMKETDLETEFRPVFTRFANERFNREGFGDWCDRVLLNEPASGVSAS